MPLRPFADHFSGHAAHYQRHRPRYPSSLFAWLASLTSRHERAWDVATGNGQAAHGVVEHYDGVIATDASAEQISHAVDHPRIRYRVAPAEMSGLEDASVDLVTVAAGVHWFDRAQFYDEVARVARQGSVLAVWSYRAEVRGPPALERAVDSLAEDVFGTDWPDQFALVRDAYRSLDFPFEEVTPPTFTCSAKWSLDDAVGVVGSWSGAQRYRRRIGLDADALADLIRSHLTPTFGGLADDAAFDVEVPLFMRVGYVDRQALSSTRPSSR